jgi:amino acid synthesis protein
MELRRLLLVEHETHREGGRAVTPPTRQVAACGVLLNPLAGRPAQDDLEELVRLSVEAGAVLAERALERLGAEPSAYGKAAIVGTGGEREHGAALIHVRLGLAMRERAGGGPALIPGVEKVGGPGTAVDLVFGDLWEPWEYDRMDSLQVSVPGAPRPDEIVLVVGFAAGGRPNARVRGATAAAAAAAWQAGGKSRPKDSQE